MMFSARRLRTNKPAAFKTRIAIGFFLLPVLSSIGACGERDQQNHAPSPVNDPTPTSPAARDFVPRAADATQIAKLKKDIREQLTKRAECVRTGTCVDEQITFAKKTLSDIPTGTTPVVMLIDFGNSLPAVARYGSRILNWYEIEENGSELIETAPSFKVPQEAKVIWSDLLDKAPFHVHPAETQEIYPEFHKHFNQATNDHSLGHLNIVFNILADYLPDAKFVVVNAEGRMPASKRVFCSQMANKVQEMDLRANRLAKSIGAVAQTYSVDFINFSGGYSYEQADNITEPECQTTPEVREAFVKAGETLLRQIGSLKDVILVQAGLNSNFKYNRLDSRAPSDCNQVPNRIRVGYFESKDSGLSPGGLNARSGEPFPLEELPAQQRNVMECLDLLVNTGYAIDAETYELDPGSKPFYTSRFGIDFRLRDWGSTTSWMAPLGLAHLAHLQKNAYESGAG